MGAGAAGVGYPDAGGDNGLVTDGSRREKHARTVLFVMLGLLGAVSYVDLTGPIPLVQAVAPVAGSLVALALVLLVFSPRRTPLRRGRSTALVALVAVVAVVAALWPVRPLGGGSAQASMPAQARTLSVLSVNTEYGQADPHEIARQVRQRSVDVLILLEESPRHWRALQDARLGDLLPHSAGSLGADAGGSVIASAQPLTCPREPAGRCALRVRPHGRGSGAVFDQPSARLPDGTLVRAIHPWPPRPDPGRWRLEQEDLRQWIASTSGPMVLAGDFNSGPVHPVFRSMVDGLDRSPRRDLPWPRTWPRETAVPPFVQIDHIVARGRVAAEEAVIAIPGSDHAAVWARLTP